jgi:hypothetical protein
VTVERSAIERAMGTWGVPAELLRPDTTIDGFVGTAGEPALARLILLLEEDLSEPFPTSLLAAVDTIGELFEFTEIKLAWASPTRGDS